MTAYPEVIPKKYGSVRVDDDPLMTKEEGSVQVATRRGPSVVATKSHSINFPHPGGSGRQVTYTVSRNFVDTRKEPPENPATI